MHALRAGATLGQYEIVRAIGSGGMGVVYEARHRQLGRRVALKVLHARAAGEATSDVAAARFLREGRAAVQVRHAHVVDVFDFGVEDGVSYLVMELVEGETLAQRLARQGALALTTLADLLLPVVSAVAELHAAGVVHRDLKPANILLARERGGEICPKVADFGVSRLDDGSPAVTESHAVIGTYVYMSPEQARSTKTTTERSDQYALGVILYECATGTKPFDAAAPYDLLHAILNEPLAPPSARVASIPPAFDALVRRAMSRDPGARFAAVEELGEALLAFASPRAAARWASEFRPSWSREGASVGGQSVDSKRPAAVPAPRAKRRHPAVYVVGGAIAATAILVARGAMIDGARTAASAAPSVVASSAPSAASSPSSPPAPPSAAPEPAPVAAAPPGAPPAAPTPSHPSAARKPKVVGAPKTAPTTSTTQGAPVGKNGAPILDPE